MDYTFDRIEQFDERSRSFRATVGLETLPLRSYSWRCNAWNDQGKEGACVGFAWSHELAARPYEYPADATVARQIYNKAKFLDPWEGEAYDGTSVLAGVQALQELLVNKKGEKLIEEYRWAFGIEDLVRALGYKGPAVLGVQWWSGMFTTDANGFIKPVGQIAGGHAILARGVKIVKIDKSKPATWDNVDMDKSYIILRNSWGQDWGLAGDARISLRDMDTILQANGEACIPVHRRK